ncbi:PorV/PorQ family protein [candidate division WOR-3 bacterium]|nr:PorV/PorQ family protein [candidate division WOR-3 bacterium]
MKKLLLGGTGIVLLMGSTLFADISDKAGTAFVTPFEVPFTARQMAMGEVSVAMSDLNSMLYNPATLAFIGKPFFTVSHLRYFLDCYKSYAAFGSPTQLGYFSGGIVYNNMGRIDLWDHGTPTGSGSIYDMAFIMGYGGRFHKYLSLGINAKFLMFDYATHTASAIATDLGVFVPYIPVFNNKGFFSTGLTIQNIGTKIKLSGGEEDCPQPLNTRLGLSLMLPDVKMFDINLGMDIQFPNDQDFKFNIGSELWINKLLALRIGYRVGGYDFDEEKFTYGFGARVGNFLIDYAYVSNGELLESNHRLTASVEIGTKKRPGPAIIVKDQWDELMKKLDGIKKDITDLKLTIEEVKDELKTAIKTVITEIEIMHLPKIHFVFNKAAVPADEYAKVGEIAELIQRHYKDKVITLEGHCDEAGTPNYNMELSRKRAQSIKKALVEMGISADNLVVVAKGEAEILTHKTGPGKSGIENRRVIIIIK